MVSIWFVASIGFSISTIWLAYALRKERAQNLCLARELIAASGQSLHYQNNLEENLQQIAQNERLPGECYVKGYAFRNSDTFRQRKHELQINKGNLN
ncbi:MAG: hypothetical protein JRE16_10280 [Deltaproteobacteria bacterium]|jgi:hypothetical protein|nr:hypothetical protein [Deltaproteobacteria bacterium]